MVVDLDRKDIINLLRGSSPSYEVWDSIPKVLGSFHGGMNDGWDWNYISLDVPYSDEYLYNLYLKCKG